MPTFLTNSRMAPELAARIERAIGGPRRRTAARRFTSEARSSRLAIVPVVAIAAVLALFFVARWQSRRDLERGRAELLGRVRAERASLGVGDEAFLQAVEPWILRFGAAYEGDSVAPELQSDPRALQAVIARPGLYVRASLPDLGSSARLSQAASGSIKDAFLLCLFDPPDDRSEKSLLAKVRGVNFGGALVEARTSHVRRLYDAEAGLRVLDPAWSERVLGARDAKDIAHLRFELERAPIQAAKQATHAELLIVVVDEVGPADLPGAEVEHPHDVRIGLVDLRADRVLLRIRRHTDPNALSAAARAIHARAVGGCGLAWDAHQAARPPARP